jgi:hypothetical protein
MRTYYQGFDGTYMKQESVYDLAVTSKPEIWQYKINWITNVKLGKVVEASFRKDPKINKSVFLLNKDIPDEIRAEVKRIKKLVFQTDKKNKLKYSCPYWIKAMYDQKYK